MQFKNLASVSTTSSHKLCFQVWGGVPGPGSDIPGCESALDIDCARWKLSGWHHVDWVERVRRWPLGGIPVLTQRAARRARSLPPTLEETVSSWSCIKTVLWVWYHAAIWSSELKSGISAVDFT